MFVLFSSALLFMLLGGLVMLYHFFVWNMNEGLLSGLRSWLGGFECGFSPTRISECYFSYTYFILLVFFVVFDLEVSLLLNVPYGFCFLKNSLFYLSFLLVLGCSYGAELYSGYVRWSY